VIMVALINVIAMATSGILSGYFYLLSVRPAMLERKIGPRAYRLCTRYRLISSIFICILIVNYVLYYFYPLEFGLPRSFPWPYLVSVAMAVGVATPAGCLLYMGVRDAGEETLSPKKEHRLYGGIYEKIRHPQTVGEMPLWLVLALFLNSPFLALISFGLIISFACICFVEDKDLELRCGKVYVEYKEKTGAFFPKFR